VEIQQGVQQSAMLIRLRPFAREFLHSLHASDEAGDGDAERAK